MKTLSIVALSFSLVSAVLVSGCGGKDAPFTIDASGANGSSENTTVTPDDSKTNVAGGATDEVISPTGGSPVTSDTVSDFADDETGEVAPAPVDTREDEPAAVERFTCRNPEPLSGYEGIVHCIEGYCKNAETGKKLDCPYGIPEGSGPAASGTPALRFPIPGLIERVPGLRFTLPAPVAVSQHDQDVSHLMNDTFPADEFTASETEIQGRIVAERGTLGESFGAALKNYVVTVLRGLIDAQEHDANLFNTRTRKLTQVIAAFKSGDLVKVGREVSEPDLRSAIEIAYASDAYVLAKAGSYLEIQFAEAYKDMAKASLQSHGEVNSLSTLVSGGDAFGLVYKPDGIIDAGFNHVSGLENADFWFVDGAHWGDIASGIRGALNAELHPVDAAAALREFEAAARSIREQGERTTDSIMRWR